MALTKETKSEEVSQNEITSPGDDELLKRIKKLDQEITEEVSKEKIDKEMLAYLTGQRILVYETLVENGVDLSKEEIQETDQMIAKLIMEALNQELAANSTKSTKEQKSKKFEKLDGGRRETEAPLDYSPRFSRMDDNYNPEIPRDNLYRGEEISYPSINQIKYDEGQDGSIIVSTPEGKKYVTDAEGNPLFEEDYDDIKRTDNGYIVRKNEKWGVYDKKGKKTIIIDYDGITPINGGYKVKIGTRFGIILNNGERLLIPKYKDIKEIEGGYKVKIKGKWGVVDFNGNEIIAPVYDSIEVKGDSYKGKKGEQVDTIKISNK